MFEADRDIKNGLSELVKIIESTYCNKEFKQELTKVLNDSSNNNLGQICRRIIDIRL